MTSSFGAMVRNDLAALIDKDLRQQGSFALAPDLYVYDVVDMHEHTDHGYTTLVYEVRDSANDYRYESHYVYHGSLSDILKELILP